MVARIPRARGRVYNKLLIDNSNHILVLSCYFSLAKNPCTEDFFFEIDIKEGLYIRCGRVVIDFLPYSKFRKNLLI